jgi:hypothetical protein
MGDRDNPLDFPLFMCCATLGQVTMNGRSMWEVGETSEVQDSGCVGLNQARTEVDPQAPLVQSLSNQSGNDPKIMA